ncbi:MAG: SpoIIE family protein phosphatase [Actinomycetota bacterium]|nr:SpoIIE family protein phosphatase [Actinomycetota bacterium]
MATFEEGYASVLGGHLRSPGEAGLDAAQDLGRRALREGLGVLEVVVTHEKVLAAAGFPREPVGERAGEEAHPALDFLLQALAPFDAPRLGFKEVREQLGFRHRQVEQLRALTEASFKMLSTFDPNDRLLLLEEAATLSLSGASVATAAGDQEEQELLAKLPPDARESFRGFKAGENFVRASWMSDAGPIHLLVARAPTPIGAGPVIAAWKQGDDFSDLDRALFRQLSQLGSVAVTNARLFEHERDIAVVLQRSLLPLAPRGAHGLELASCYIPAHPGASVGGDWFDAFELPGDRLGLVIGDVMGHDVLSAAIMGQFRIAVRAYALEGHSPAGVLDRVENLCSALVGDSYATLLYATVGTGGELFLANAGHPAPVVIGPEGRASFLEGGLSVPVCIGAPAPTRTERCALFPIGTTLFFYTDGLIERRGSSLDACLAELLNALSQAPVPLVGHLQAWCDEVVASLTGEGPEDDVCVLAVRLAGS